VRGGGLLEDLDIKRKINIRMYLKEGTGLAQWYSTGLRAG
jgi:hypothetical protein